MSSRRSTKPEPLTLQTVCDWLAATASEAKLGKLARYSIPDDHAIGVAEAHADEDRSHVTMTTSITLRATGKRNAALRAAALDWADQVELRSCVEPRLVQEVRRELGWKRSSPGLLRIGRRTIRRLERLDRLHL